MHIDGKNKMTKIALIISEFNEEITSKMEKTAEKYAADLGVKIVKKIHVPGALEIPFAAKNLFKGKEIDAIVTLGAIIKGETDHDVLISNIVAQKLMDLSLQYNKPIGFGVIGPGATWQKTKERAVEYSKRAVKAALDMVNLKNK